MKTNLKRLIVSSLSIVAMFLTSNANLREAKAGDVDLDTGVTHYYSYDDADNIGADNSVANVPATIIGSSSSTNVKSGKSYNLDGGYAILPNDVITTKFSFSTWIYPTSNEDWQKILDLGRGKDLYFQLAFRTGSVGKLHIQTSLIVDGDEADRNHLWGGSAFDAVNMNTWSHIVLTVDENQANVYVNNVNVKTGTFGHTISEFLSKADAQSSNYMGTSHFSDPSLKGYLDESIFYDVILSNEQIAALYEGKLPTKHQGTSGGGEDEEVDVDSNLITYYSFDNVHAGVDESGNKKNLILSHKDLIPTTDNIVNDKLGKSLEFNGKTNFLIEPTNIIPKDDNQFTFTTWMYLKSFGEFTRIFDFGESSAYFDFRMRANGVLETTLTHNNTGGETIVRTKTNSFEVGKWHHIGLTINGTSVTIYVDGNIAGLGQFARGVNTFYTYKNNISEEGQNFIGLSRYGQDPKFDGFMDEIRVYYRCLNKADISYLAKGNKAAPENPEISTELLINGVENKIEYFSNIASDVTFTSNCIFLSNAIKVSELKSKLTLNQDVTMEFVNKYDENIADNENISDKTYVKMFYKGIIKDRILVHVGKYNIVSFDSNGGEEVDDIIAMYGETIELPYIIKEGHELTGWYEGDNKVSNTYEVKKNIILKAKWTAREYTIKIEYHNNEVKEIKATYGSTVNLTNFGHDDVIKYRYYEKVYEFGNFVMPGHTVYLKGVYDMKDIDVDDLGYTTYNGNFKENADGTRTSTSSFSLALIDDVELENGEYEIKMTADNRNDCGLLFWVDCGSKHSFWEDSGAYYYTVLMNKDGYLLLARVNYSGQTWECMVSPKIDNFQVNHEYDIKVTIYDNQIKVYVDGVLHITYNNTFAHTGNGIGFRSTNSGVTFDIVKIDVAD